MEMSSFLQGFNPICKTSVACIRDGFAETIIRLSRRAVSEALLASGVSDTVCLHHVHDEATGQGAAETENQGTCQMGEEVDGGHGGSKKRLKGDWTAAVLGVENKELEAGFSRV